MVELKKRARSRFEQSFESGGFSVPYGDAVSPVVSRSSTRRGLSFEFGGGWSSSKHSSFSWLVKLLYILAVVSCIAAYRTTTEAKTISQSLEAQQTALRLQGDETTLTLKDARMGLQSMRTYVDSLKKTQEALYHEIRMVNEMFEAESASDMPPSPKRGSPDTLVKSWMKHRQDALEHKIENLKAFIQQESRDQVIEK